MCQLREVVYPTHLHAAATLLASSQLGTVVFSRFARSLQILLPALASCFPCKPTASSNQVRPTSGAPVVAGSQTQPPQQQAMPTATPATRSSTDRPGHIPPYSQCHAYPDRQLSACNTHAYPTLKRTTCSKQAGTHVPYHTQQSRQWAPAPPQLPSGLLCVALQASQHMQQAVPSA